jgi:hypothetical protein
MSRLPPRLVAAKMPASRRRLPRETFGMLRDRGFRLTIYCDPCKEMTAVNLIERPELAQVEIRQRRLRMPALPEDRPLPAGAAAPSRKAPSA